MDADIFDLVYEGFWDLYCMRPRCDGITPKMITTWLNRFILQVSPDEAAAVDEVAEPVEEVAADAKSGDEEGKSEEGEKPEPEAKIPDVAAVVRIRIPKQSPEPEIDEDGNPIEIDPATIDWSKADEVPPEDKAFSMAVNV